MIKRIFTVAFFIFLLGCCGDDNSDNSGIITTSIGEVYLFQGLKKNNLKKNMIVVPGSKIKTGDKSYAIINFKHETIILYLNTEVAIGNEANAKKKNLQKSNYVLRNGMSHFKIVNKKSGQKVRRMQVGGTTFFTEEAEVYIGKDKNGLSATVISGELKVVKNNVKKDTLILKANQRLSLNKDGVYKTSSLSDEEINDIQEKSSQKNLFSHDKSDSKENEIQDQNQKNKMVKKARIRNNSRKKVRNKISVKNTYKSEIDSLVKPEIDVPRIR